MKPINKSKNADVKLSTWISVLSSYESLDILIVLNFRYSVTEENFTQVILPDEG